MLRPTDRASIYDALRPPPGSTVDLLVACTYSASLDTVLSLPAAMVAGAGPFSARTTFGAAELAALRRVCDRTAIFCQAGAIHPAEMVPPAVVEVEPMVHEVIAPMGGAFHPKLWVMRFRDEKGRASLRVAVLSRNLTDDRSWDLGLVAEGRPASKARANDVSDLLRLLPGWSRRSPTAERLALVEELAHEVECTRWRMPDGMGAPEFRAIGTGPGKAWEQPLSERLLLLSPFLTTPTVRALGATSSHPLALVSRPDGFDRCWPAASSAFARQMVLTPPGEEGATGAAALHGKALVWERRNRMFAAVGSMNATCAARLGRNVEFMATFECTAAVGHGGVEALLNHEALGAVVQDYEPADADAALTDAFDDRPARALLTAADLRLHCEREPDGWRVSLAADRPLSDQVGELLPNLRYRPATLPGTAAFAPCGQELADGRPAPFPGLLDLTAITGFIVFQADGPEGAIAFCRNVEVSGVDHEERRAAAVRALLPDRARFEDFLRTMLGDPAVARGDAGDGGDGSTGGAWTQGPRPGLLELLVRCSIDDPDRFMALRGSVDALGPERLSTVAPTGFLPLWEALVAANS